MSATHVRFVFSAEPVKRLFPDETPVLTLKLHAVTYDESDGMKNPSDSTWNNPFAGFAGFVVNAQVDATGDIYGWRCEYREVFAIDMARADIMLKHLRKVQRGLDKLQGEFGYPESFGAYVARVASVLKVRHFGWHVSGTAWNYDANEYRWTDIAGLTYHVNQAVSDWREALVS